MVWWQFFNCVRLFVVLVRIIRAFVFVFFDSQSPFGTSSLSSFNSVPSLHSILSSFFYSLQDSTRKTQMMFGLVLELWIQRKLKPLQQLRSKTFLWVFFSLLGHNLWWSWFISEPKKYHPSRRRIMSRFTECRHKLIP